MNDIFEGAEQPRCIDDGTLMRDLADGWECPACGARERLLQMQKLPAEFEGLRIHNG